MLPTLTLEPIGVVRSPFLEAADAPRQACVANVAGRIELVAGRHLEDAVADLASWSHLWVVFWFHKNAGYRPKVLPPRSLAKRGVLATRSPHRPNPIGLSAVRLERVDGLVLHVRDLDMLDGTPVLDLKPYVPYADVVAGATSGWLDAGPRDPAPSFEVAWSASAEVELAFVEAAGVRLREPVAARLALGPQPHAYRRITLSGDTGRLAYKDWRISFRVAERRIEVTGLATGYRPRELATSPDPALDVHRRFAARFGR